MMRLFSILTWFLLIVLIFGIGPRFHRVGADPPVVRDLQDVRLPEENVVINDSPLNAKAVAQGKFDFEAMRSDARLRELAQQKLDAVRTEFDARCKEFLAGRGTLEFVLKSSLRYLHSEVAVCEKRTDQMAALERHWAMLRCIEEVNRGRFEAGRIPTKDYKESIFYRMQAEIWLHQARDKGLSQ
jgi:hypothetical protein